MYLKKKPQQKSRSPNLPLNLLKRKQEPNLQKKKNPLLRLSQLHIGLPTRKFFPNFKRNLVKSKRAKKVVERQELTEKTLTNTGRKRKVNMRMNSGKITKDFIPKKKH